MIISYERLVRIMKTGKLISLLGTMAMTVVLLYGFIIGDFASDGGEILKNPWGIVSLVDLYVGFSLFSLWIAYREKNLLLKILWISAMMILGFFAGSVYVLLHLMLSRGDMLKFFLGHRKDELLMRAESGERSEHYER